MMLLYAKIFLEIKGRGKLNIGRYSSYNPKSSSRQTVERPVAESGNEARQASIKSKPFRLKERLSENLSLRDDKLRKENNSMKEVSFKDNRSRATWSGSNAKRKMVLVECSKLNNGKQIIPKVDLCVECEADDQVSNSLVKNKAPAAAEANEKQIESNVENDLAEKIRLEEDLARKDNGNGGAKTKDNESGSVKKTEDGALNKEAETAGEEATSAEGKSRSESVVAGQKYQQLTVLTAGSVESQLKELKTLESVKVEVQIVTAPDENEVCGEEISKDQISEVVGEQPGAKKRQTDQNIDGRQEAEENGMGIRKWFLLPKVTVYLQKNLHLDKRRKKRQKERKLTNNLQASSFQDDQSSPSIGRLGKPAVAATLDTANTEINSVDTVVDKFNERTRKLKAFRPLLWFSKISSSPHQSDSVVYANSPIDAATRRRIEIEETGSLSFDFSSSVPRFSLEDLHTLSSIQPPTAKQTFVHSRLLPFSCSSSSLRINRGSPPVRGVPEIVSIGEKAASRSSLINRTLNRNALTKSTINLTASTSNTLNLASNNETVDAHCLSINRPNLLQQPNHSLSLHLPSNSSTSVNQTNSVLTNSSDYITTQSNQSSFYLSRIESSRLRQEKKAIFQLGLIMGGFLLCWLPYIIIYIVMGEKHLRNTQGYAPSEFYSIRTNTISFTAQCNCIDATTHTIAIWLGYINSSLNPGIFIACQSDRHPKRCLTFLILVSFAVLYFMGPNSSRFKAALRKLLLRKPVPKYMMDHHTIHANGKMVLPSHLAGNTAPGLTFNTTLTTNPLNQKAGSVHTRLARSTSNKSYQTKNEFADHRPKRNKALNCSLKEINNNS